MRKAERKRTLIDESLPSILPSIIHPCIRSRLNKVQDEGEGAGSGGMESGWLEEKGWTGWQVLWRRRRWWWERVRSSDEDGALEVEVVFLDFLGF